MKQTTRKIKLQVSIFMLLLSSFVVSAPGQCEKTNIFEEVPISARNRLIERLSLRVEYEKTGQWEKLYDLLYLPDMGEVEYNKRKEEYIRINTDPTEPRNRILIEFIPREITLATEIGKDTYYVEGCATFQIKKEIIKKYDIFFAHLVNGDWFFSSFGEVEPNKLCEQ